MTTPDLKPGWHFDKRITIAFVFVIAMQTATGIWWAATQSARMDAIEQWVADNKSVTERLAVIETNQINIQRTVDRIDRKLESSP